MARSNVPITPWPSKMRQRRGPRELAWSFMFYMKWFHTVFSGKDCKMMTNWLIDTSKKEYRTDTFQNFFMGPSRTISQTLRIMEVPVVYYSSCRKFSVIYIFTALIPSAQQQSYQTTTVDRMCRRPTPCPQEQLIPWGQQHSFKKDWKVPNILLPSHRKNTSARPTTGGCWWTSASS